MRITELTRQKDERISELERQVEELEEEREVFTERVKELESKVEDLGDVSKQLKHCEQASARAERVAKAIDAVDRIHRDGGNGPALELADNELEKALRLWRQG